MRRLLTHGQNDLNVVGVAFDLHTVKSLEGCGCFISGDARHYFEPAWFNYTKSYMQRAEYSTATHRSVKVDIG